MWPFLRTLPIARKTLIVGLFGWFFDHVRTYESCGLVVEVLEYKWKIEIQKL